MSGRHGRPSVASSQGGRGWRPSTTTTTAAADDSQQQQQQQAQDADESEEARHLRRRNHAATRIQRAYRGHVVRHSTIPLQRHVAAVEQAWSLRAIFDLLCRHQLRAAQAALRKAAAALDDAQQQPQQPDDAGHPKELVLRQGATAASIAAAAAMSELSPQSSAKLPGMDSPLARIGGAALAAAAQEPADGALPVALDSALSLGSFVLFAHDFALMSNTVSHQFLQRLFTDFSDAMPMEALLCAVRALFESMQDVQDAQDAQGDDDGPPEDDEEEETISMANLELLFRLLRIPRPPGGFAYLSHHGRARRQRVLDYVARESAPEELRPAAGMRFEQFRGALRVLAGRRFPANDLCHCPACTTRRILRQTDQSRQWFSADEDQRALDEHLDHALERFRVDALVAVAEDMATTEVSSPGSSFGDMLQAPSVLPVLVDYEKSLRRIYVFYASNEWRLPPEERVSWLDIVDGQMQVGFGEFLRFASDFGLYPRLVGNDVSNSFELLSIFLAAKLGNRAGLRHHCEPGAFVPRCTLCGDDIAKLSPWEIAKIRLAFARYDTDHSGELDLDEVQAMLKDLGKDPTPGELVTMMREMDTDGSGQVSVDEFLRGMVRGEQLGKRAERAQLSLPEFVHAVVVCARVGYSRSAARAQAERDRLADHGLKLKKLMAHLEPIYKVKFGRDMTPYRAVSAPPDDADFLQRQSELRRLLAKIFVQYCSLRDSTQVEQLSEDAFHLFVADSGLFPQLRYEDVHRLFSECATRDRRVMSRDAFVAATDLLLHENYVAELRARKVYLSDTWQVPLPTHGDVTPMMIAKTHALTRLKALYGVYQLPRRMGAAERGAFRIGIAEYTPPRHDEHGGGGGGVPLPDNEPRGNIIDMWGGCVIGSSTAVRRQLAEFIIDRGAASEGDDDDDSAADEPGPGPVTDEEKADEEVDGFALPPSSSSTNNNIKGLASTTGGRGSVASSSRARSRVSRMSRSIGLAATLGARASPLTAISAASPTKPTAAKRRHRGHKQSPLRRRVQELRHQRRGLQARTDAALQQVVALAAAQRQQSPARARAASDTVSGKAPTLTALSSGAAASLSSRQKANQAAVINEAFQRALKLQSEDSSLDAAATAWAQVVRLATHAQNARVLAAATGNLGVIHKQQGQFQRALEALKQHLHLVQTLPGDNRHLECKALGNLAGVFMGLHRYSAAQMYHRQRLDLAVAIGDRESERLAHIGIGVALLELGHAGEALHHFRCHQELAAQAGRRVEEAGGHGNIGNALFAQGHFEQALESHRRELDALGAPGVDDNEADAQRPRVFRNLGIAHMALAQHEEALAWHKRELEAALRLRDRALLADANSHVGACILSRHSGLSSLPHLHAAYARAFPVAPLAQASTMSTCGEAAQYLDRALQLARDINDQRLQAKAHCNLGATFALMQMHREAVEHHEHALALALQQQDKAGETSAYAYMGTAFLAAGRAPEAVSSLERALELASSLQNYLLVRALHSHLGAAYFELREFEEARQHHELYLTAVQHVDDAQLQCIGHVHMAIVLEAQAEELSSSILLQTAAGHLRRFNSLCAADRHEELAFVCHRLAGLHTKLGNVSDALHFQELCAHHYHELGDLHRESDAVEKLGHDLVAAGQHARATDTFKRHLQLTRETGDREAEGRACANLGKHFAAWFGEVAS